MSLSELIQDQEVLADCQQVIYKHSNSQSNGAYELAVNTAVGKQLSETHADEHGSQLQVPTSGRLSVTVDCLVDFANKVLQSSNHIAFRLVAVDVALGVSMEEGCITVDVVNVCTFQDGQNDDDSHRNKVHNTRFVSPH